MKITALTTPTCVKCKMVIPKMKTLCESKGVEFLVMDATKEGKELAIKNEIMSVPSFILSDGSEETIYRGEDAYYDIRAKIESSLALD